MMKNLLLASTVAVAAIAAAPASATLIAPGTAGLSFSAFDAASQGTRLEFSSQAAPALTFAAILRSAVYRNTSGTLDFYYQVARTGAGTAGDSQIFRLTNADFTGFTVDALVRTDDFDGTGGFAAVNNTIGGTSTTTVGRSPDGEVMQTNFGNNGLVGTENSATYVFRTNATAFTTGTFGILDGSAAQGLTFAPGAIPEPASWAMMISGFGLIGSAMRRRVSKVAFAA